MAKTPEASRQDDYVSPTADVGLDDAARAMDRDWAARDDILDASPVSLFLKEHEIAGSPNELIITGVAGIKVSLGDLRALVRALK
jgi:hypothetical protein